MSDADRNMGNVVPVTEGPGSSETSHDTTAIPLTVLVRTPDTNCVAVDSLQSLVPSIEDI
jgi:hypothetical protein